MSDFQQILKDAKKEEENEKHIDIMPVVKGGTEFGKPVIPDISEAEFQVGDIIVLDWSKYKGGKSNSIFAYRIVNIIHRYGQVFNFHMVCNYNGKWGRNEKIYDSKLLKKIEAFKINNIEMFELLYG